jgi:hypothetical protein
MAVLTLLSTVAAYTMVLPAIPSTPGVSPGMVGTFMHFGALFGAVISAVFIVLYYIGYSWMRWVVMIYSLFPIVGLVRVPKAMQVSHLAAATSIASALLGIFLLWYLNTPDVKAWFNSPKGAATV